jgi:hypothetical protein
VSTEIVVTIGLFVAGGFIGWLFRIDRLITKVVANQDNGEKQFNETRASNLQEFSKLWQAHVDDVRDLGAVKERLAGIESSADIAERITNAIHSLRKDLADDGK